ncbi:MAG: cbb3-type cytochrome oxidase assembly protein CcoS [Helicobacteraceae bacterium]|nr:cbb3-type cytochrome oxidase assembly protein CcoS [Helicobacteraceae bacterium]
MDNGIIAIMLGISLIMGLLGLIAFLWGLRSGQFDDENKFTQGILMDGIDELNEAYKNTNKKEKNGK